MKYQSKRKKYWVSLGFVVISLVLFPILTQSVYLQTRLDQNKSKAIRQALSKMANDGKAPGMIAAK